jgi:acyl-CoA reductase-like NAD-dependent aldehyde dehydrogenase
MAIIEPIETHSAERRFRVASPATKKPVGEVTVANEVDVRAAVARARQAQPAWQALGFDGRARIMQKALSILLEEQDRYIEVIRSETGRSAFETLMMEIFPACDSLCYYAKRAAEILRDERPRMHLLRTKKLVISYQPLGVIGIVTPWNGPFILALNPSVQALMAGNTVVLKPSEVTPFSGRLAAELLEQAGLPKDVFSVVQGDGATGAALVRSEVDKICFTGSVATGRKIAVACAERLIPCTLELGGKDPMIVCADADLERAAGGAVFGGFINAGQFCCGTERVYVVESVADEFVNRVVEKVRALRLGSAGEYDVGPMIWPKQLETVERHVADAVAKGARVLTGGRRKTELGELFYEPTVVVDVTPEMAVMREETFGPVLAIARARDEEHALELANDSSYGLSSTLWTRDDKRALSMARRIEAGSVCVNDSSITYGATEAPFGGRKTSGLGQANGETGLKGFCYAKPIIIDRFGMKAEQVWYPYTEEKAQLLRKIMRWLWGTPLGRLLS